MKRLFLFFVVMGFSLSSHAGFVEGEEAFNDQRYTQAFNEFLPLAEAGDFRSEYYIGYLYLNGYGVAQNNKKALQYLQRAIDKNYDMAQSLMAYLYSEGKAVRKDKSKALSLYEQAANQGNASALLNLGVIYYTGDGVDKNSEKALEYFKKISLTEKPIVAKYLGDLYLNDPKLQSYPKAFYYYTLSAKSGDVSSFYALGEMNRKGLGMVENIDTALKYYRYAAAQNYAPAQYTLGVIYANGEGVKRDPYEAYAWFSLAAEQKLKQAEEARDQLAEGMSLSDLDKARRQLIQIQQREIGKVESPLLAEASPALLTGATAGSIIDASQNSQKRILRRRRRR